jgi:hypothetical protein
LYYAWFFFSLLRHNNWVNTHMNWSFLINFSILLVYRQEICFCFSLFRWIDSCVGVKKIYSQADLKFRIKGNVISFYSITVCLSLKTINSPKVNPTETVSLGIEWIFQSLIERFSQVFTNNNYQPFWLAISGAKQPCSWQLSAFYSTSNYCGH